MPRLTLCLIARDEEALLGDCLASVRGIVDEIVVVDTGSRDGTVALARAAGATVVDFPWRDDFAAARNAALAAASGEWILVLDADERLVPGAGAALAAAIREASFDCGWLPLFDAATLSTGPAEVAAGEDRIGEPRAVARLFRRTPDLAWHGVVRESVLPRRAGERTAHIDAAIVHYGEVPERRMARGTGARDLRLLERRCDLEPRSPVARAHLALALVRSGHPGRAAREAENAWQDLLEAGASGQTEREPGAVVRVATLRGRMLLDLNRPTEVLTMLVQVETWGGSDPNLDFLRGLALDQLGLPGAEAALRRALARHAVPAVEDRTPGATSWAAWTRLGHVLLAEARATEALACFDAALHVRPADLDAKLGRIEALLAHRPADALEAVMPLLEKGEADAWLLAAAASDALGAGEECALFLGRAAATQPLGVPRRQARYKALTTLSPLRPRFVELKATHLHGESAAALVQRAEDALEADDVPVALGAWLAALRHDPADAASWLGLAGTLHALELPEEAAALMAGARRLLPNHPEVMASSALLFSFADDLGEAARHARKALALDPDHPVAAEVLESVGVHGAGGPLLPDPLVEPLLGDVPLISVIVPTYGRPAPLLNLLDRLSLQDLDPRAFEVVVVDDGSPVPVADTGPRPFRLTLLRQENAGPAAARNLALAHARGRYVLIYNDDALPALDGVRGHLHAQLATKRPEAVLGTFDFLPEHQESTLIALLQRTTLMFAYVEMQAGQLYSWQMFWTCNLSIPRAAILAVGGFDTTFRFALCEDIELGYRLEKTGVKVRYRPDIPAGHDHLVTWEGYMARAERLGRELHRMRRRHDLPMMLRGQSKEFASTSPTELRAQVETNADTSDHLIGTLGRALRLGLPALRDAQAAQVTAIRAAGSHQSLQGIVQADSGFTDGTRPRALRTRGSTSIVIPNLNGFPHLEGCLSTLRRHTDATYELIIVDNGSNDGSLEWLRKQPDVRLLEMGTNLGAPAARNRGLAVASGERVLFCDNDVLFTPRWHELLTGHLHAWPDIGMVGPVSDYVVDAQKVRRPPAAGEELDDYAAAIHAEQRGRHAYSSQLILFFILARREVVEQIGGIDEIYGRWGFEDNDWALRARIAGWKLRIARDCFIRHLGSRTAKTANIDYDRLLAENWVVFKKKWGIDPKLPYGARLSLAEIEARPFDPALHYVKFR